MRLYRDTAMGRSGSLFERGLCVYLKGVSSSCFSRLFKLGAEKPTPPLQPTDPLLLSIDPLLLYTDPPP